jgi:hypothetical protein
MAAHSADLVLIYGNESRRARNAMIEGGLLPEILRSFPDIWAVADFLRTGVGSGDVALLRGRLGDAAARIYFAQLGSVGCRIPNCPCFGPGSRMRPGCPLPRGLSGFPINPEGRHIAAQKVRRAES